MAKKVIKKAQTGGSISTNPYMQVKLDKAKQEVRKNPYMQADIEKRKIDLEKAKLTQRSANKMKSGGKVKKKK